MIRVQGAAAAVRQLEELADAITNGTAAAITAEAELLQAEAKRRCPMKTGALRESLRAQVLVRGAQTEATVGSVLPYAAAVELGTPGTPPQPYLAPALRARASAVTEHLKRVVQDATGENR